MATVHDCIDHQVLGAIALFLESKRNVKVVRRAVDRRLSSLVVSRPARTGTIHLYMVNGRLAAIHGAPAIRPLTGDTAARVGEFDLDHPDSLIHLWKLIGSTLKKRYATVAK